MEQKQPATTPQPKTPLSHRPMVTLAGPWGIPVVVRNSAVVIPIISVLVALQDPTMGIVVATQLLLAIFIHEAAHAWAARRQGLRVLEITFHSIGGLCTYELPKHPSQRIWVAFAGPMSNLWLFLAAEALLQLPVSESVAQHLNFCSILNLLLAIVNLVPAPHADGGRMLEAFVSCYLPKETTIRICGWVALWCALALPAVLIGGALMGVILAYWIPVGLAWRMADTGRMDPAPAPITPEPEIRDDHPLLVAASRIQTGSAPTQPAAA